MAAKSITKGLFFSFLFFFLLFSLCRVGSRAVNANDEEHPRIAPCLIRC